MKGGDPRRRAALFVAIRLSTLHILFFFEEDKTMRMRKSVVLVSVFFLFFAWANFFNQASSQTRARTEAGKEVILYPDGTWKYFTGLTPTVKYTKSASANKLFKTERGNFGIWIDESKWKVPRKSDEEGKWQFQLIREDGYAMSLAEGIEIPITSLKELALENAQMAAQDSKIVFEENRVVNGREILCLKIEGTMKQIPFTFYGYYYGGKEGSIQLITYTGQKLFTKYEQEFTKFLNGLVISP